MSDGEYDTEFGTGELATEAYDSDSNYSIGGEDISGSSVGAPGEDIFGNIVSERSKIEQAIITAISDAEQPVLVELEWPGGMRIVYDNLTFTVRFSNYDADTSAPWQRFTDPRAIYESPRSTTQAQPILSLLQVFLPLINQRSPQLDEDALREQIREQFSFVEFDTIMITGKDDVTVRDPGPDIDRFIGVLNALFPRLRMPANSVSRLIKVVAYCYDNIQSHCYICGRPQEWSELSAQLCDNELCNYRLIENPKQSDVLGTYRDGNYPMIRNLLNITLAALKMGPGSQRSAEVLLHPLPRCFIADDGAPGRINLNPKRAEKAIASAIEIIEAIHEQSSEFANPGKKNSRDVAERPLLSFDNDTAMLNSFIKRRIDEELKSPLHPLVEDVDIQMHEQYWDGMKMLWWQAAILRQTRFIWVPPPVPEEYKKSLAEYSDLIYAVEQNGMLISVPRSDRAPAATQPKQKSKAPDVPPETITVYHGSGPFNWISLMRNGPQILSGTQYMSTGAAYGNGIYTAKTPHDPIGYSSGITSSVERNAWRPHYLSECSLTIDKHKKSVEFANSGNYCVVKDSSLLKIKKILII